MKDLIIVGAGGFGRELLQWCKDINKQQPTWKLKGFIDDNSKALYGYECDYNVIGSIKDWKPSDNEEFALAVAEPHLKEKIVSILKDKGANFTSIIHPRAIVSDFSKIGEGIILYPNTTIGPNTIIGNFTTIFSGVGHDAIIEDFVTISSMCDICGHAFIGKRTFLASHAVVIPSKKIGSDCYIGAGSVVIKNIPPNSRTFGNPAKIFDF